MPPGIIDPLTGPRYALEGKVVTMDPTFRVLERGLVYIDAGQITAIQPTGDAPPPGFEGSPVIQTRGTIYPGLIELHNHLSYNALPLWNVPQKFTNRNQWGSKPDYRKLISGPMYVLGRTPGYVEAIVRYVECKCLMGGVTTSQGVALYSNNGIQKYYRGIIRNVEETGEEILPDAKTKISDVEATQASKFLEALNNCECLLLHLSEGIDEKAHQHFEALQLENGEWALAPSLAGIHCAGLRPEDFQILQEHGTSMIWSPLSNLLLYGCTADIQAAKTSGIRIGIGSDWSSTGSKNLLGELKVARLVSQDLGGVFTDREILAMATCNAAQILKWDTLLGSIEPGKRADLLVLYGRNGDPYERILTSSETAIALVVVNGVPRYGQERLMEPFGPGTENWQVRSARRVLNLKHETGDPIVGGLTLRQARERLKDGMRRLPELARELETPPPAGPMRAGAGPQVPQWFLVLDHNDTMDASLRPHLPLRAGEAPTGLLAAAASAVPLSQLLEPIELDGLTVADDRKYLDRIAQQMNLPGSVKAGLPNLY